MIKLVDAYGKPIDSGTLREPQTSRLAATTRPLIESHLDGLTPHRAAHILKMADQGVLRAQAELFDDMLDRDAHLRCEYDKRAAAPCTVDWTIEPPAGASRAEKKAAAAVEEMLRDTVDDLDDVLLSMMDAPGYGYAAIEIEWERWGGEWIPNFHPRPHSWLTTDPGRTELRLADGTACGETLQPFGWIVHQHKKIKTGYIGRAGLFRACLWPFIYKAYSIGDFAEFLETYGLPIIVGKYMPGAHDDEKASLLRAVTSLGHDARAIMPDDMRLEIPTVSSGASSNLHLLMVDWADRAQSKAILGQVLSSEARATGMGSGVADLHAEVRNDILLSDLRQLAGTLTRDLVYPLVALNHSAIDGYRRCPRWVFDTAETDDMAVYAEALPRLVGVGLRIPRRWAQERLRIPDPESDDDVLAVDRPDMTAPPALRDQSVPPVPDAAAARARRTVLAALAGPLATPQDEVDRLLSTLQDGADPLVQTWAAALRALLDVPGMTLERYQNALLGAWGDLPADKLVDLMTSAYAVAELAGMDAVRSESD